MTAKCFSFQLENFFLPKFKESSLKIIFEFTNHLGTVPVETYSIRVPPFGTSANIYIMLFSFIYIDYLGYAGIYYA